jgi:hypothetical protein
MKTKEFLAALVYVAVVSSAVTILTSILFPRTKTEGFEDGDADLPQQFTPQEEAKLRVLRNKQYFTTDSNGVNVNIPVWINRELRITNASSTNGALRLQRSNGTTSRLSVADSFQGSAGVFTKDRQSYFMIPSARDLVVTNGDGTQERIQPYTVGYKSPQTGMVLYGYPTDPVTNKAHSKQYTNEQDAYRECTRISTTGGNCAGLEKDNTSGKYTLRAGNGGLQKSTIGDAETAIPRY